jgi:hypothetical protein
LLYQWVAEDDYDAKKIALNEKGNESSRFCIEANYQVLSILDAKASALMRLDGVLLAACLVGLTAKLYDVKSCAFGILAYTSLASMLLCLLVVAVDWKFLGYVIKTANGFDFTQEISHLRRVRAFRERVYQLAWWLAFVASMAFAIIITLQMLK